MTLTLDKLRALKRQAGASDAPASNASPAASPHHAAAPVATATPTSRESTPHAERAAPAASGRAASASASASAIAPVPAPRSDIVGVAPADTPPGAARAANVDALRRLLGLRDRVPSAQPRARARDRTLPGTEVDDGLWLIESRVAHPSPDAPLPLAFARRDDHVDAAHLLFFDTETTGLAGGTGTRAFMIGAADWFDGGLRVRQLLIANMAAERAMLRTFASWLAPATVLASYNGRSYDAPLLRTRYRLARLKDPLHGLDHLDLLHPSRRRWRGRWENCRLATIEREALRILREDDLPGSQAPAAWLSYLRGGDSVNLRRVAEHNRQDVATLAQLLVRLCDERGDAEPPVAR